MELQDPIVHHVHLSSSITVGEEFTFQVHSGAAICTISGTVPQPVNGVYNFPIKIDESHGKGMSMNDTQNLSLSLGKPLSAGPIASFVYLRTFTLTLPDAAK